MFQGEASLDERRVGSEVRQRWTTKRPLTEGTVKGGDLLKCSSITESEDVEIRLQALSSSLGFGSTDACELGVRAAAEANGDLGTTHESARGFAQTRAANTGVPTVLSEPCQKL